MITWWDSVLQELEKKSAAVATHLRQNQQAEGLPPDDELLVLLLELKACIDKQLARKRAVKVPRNDDADAGNTI